jgi:hypothetical protein
MACSQRPDPRGARAYEETIMNTSNVATDWELRFDALFAGRCGFVFPCTAEGRVNMDALSERALNNYLYARAMMGREVTWPSVYSSRVH